MQKIKVIIIFILRNRDLKYDKYLSTSVCSYKILKFYDFCD